MNFYIIDAIKIAGEVGLGNRINMVMQSAFFKLANVIPLEDAVKYLKESIIQSYGRKGQKIVDMNHKAVDMGLEALVKVEVPAEWANVKEEEPVQPADEPDFVTRIQRPMARLEGDELPVTFTESIWKTVHSLGTQP